MAEAKQGPEILEEAAQEPTLDTYLQRDPATLTPKDLEQVVRLERKRRAAFIEASAKRKEQKKEDEDGEE